MRSDVIVLGAGMVGISAALHLQQRGRSVTLLDRRGPAEETSYGNTGVIQREGIVPYMFPRELMTILRYGLNTSVDATYHITALPRIAPWLFRYWRASTPEGKAASARAMMPLIERCITEHEALMQAAGVTAMMRPTGYVKAFRSEEKLVTEIAESEAERAEYGVNFRPLDKAALAVLEPHVRDRFVGAVHMPDPVTIADPGGLGKAYAELFVRQGGRLAE
ncbi:MAG: NAD(P)/FAD-dependent oxidoreductase, partial [Solimonas sp.]